MRRANDPRVELLYGMMRIRTTEETLADLYKEQEMRTPTHFSIGQEAVAVGVCAALLRSDVVYSGHRCHAHYLAKGGDLAGMVAELYGKDTGCCRGRGGSVHLNDPAVGVVASSAILGQTIAVAAGSALAFKLDGSERVAVTFFGDGAIEEGIFHESLNFAVVKKLPVLFVCENNGYSTHTRLPVRQPDGIAIHERARSYGMPAQLVDGNDVFAVSAAARHAVSGVRRGEGPFFLECTTYRWREHVGPLWDYDKGYRAREEVEQWIARCPIKRARERLLADGICTNDDLSAFEAELRAEVARAVAAAKAAPFPAVQDLVLGTY
ncbi:MAG: thiamine pyrophosphate-dependent dehydrogenase E1 component subunit alpha [Candidatus Rokuibacteriota bacterium]